MEDEIDLKASFDVIIKHWKIIALIGVIGASIGLFQGIRQPKLYKATATVMTTDSGGGGLGAALSLFGAFGGGGGSGSMGESKLIPILKSRALATEVAKSFELAMINPKLANDEKLSDDQKRQALADKVNSAIEAKVGKSGLLEITATWKDPIIAAEVANKFVEGLGRFLNARALNINFQLIDSAIPAEAPFNQKTGQNGVIGVVLGLFLGSIVAFGFDFWEKATKRK